MPLCIEAEESCKIVTGLGPEVVILIQMTESDEVRDLQSG